MRLTPVVRDLAVECVPAQRASTASAVCAVMHGGWVQGNPVSRTLFAAAYAQKRAALRAGDLTGGRLGPFWDALVFSKIRARLGGAPCLSLPCC